MATALISLGANLGDRAGTLARAVNCLNEHPQISVIRVSRWHATAPVGGPSGQAEFLNGAAALQTGLAPHELLTELQRIESHLGRTRNERWSARTLDLDLLLYDELVLDTEDLTLPHPRMGYRRFVLAPAAEAAPTMRHPCIDWDVATLLKHLEEAPPQIAFCGAYPPDRHELARRVAARTRSTAVFPKDELSWLECFLKGEQGVLPSAALNWRDEVERETARLPIDSSSLLLNGLWSEQALKMAGLEEPSSPVKLVVFFDEPADATARKLRWPELALSESSHQRLRDYEKTLRSLAQRPRRGPWLTIDPNDMDWGEEEVTAAVNAS